MLFRTRVSIRICSLMTHSFLQSLGSSSVLKQNSRYIFLNSGYFHRGSLPRCFTISLSYHTVISLPLEKGEVQSVPDVCSDQHKMEKRNNFPRKFVMEIIDIIRKNEKGLEYKLSAVASRLSLYSVTEIFEILNSQRVSGLSLFQWLWSNNPQLGKNVRICSLIIGNSGGLEDYETMFVLLKKFRSENICLTYDAFGFLPVLASTNSSLKEPTKKVVDLLNTVGGSCRYSGVSALIEMFCKLDLFEMARYVIKITECKESYFCLLIREKCGKGLIEDSLGIIKEMREANCVPTTRIYNYVISSLCKNDMMDEASRQLDEMKEFGILPNAITFEILITSFCRFGEMDIVHQFLDQMVSQGIEPRLATHAFIVKTLFVSENYEGAHKYVIDSNIVYKTSSNTMYSLLANLYREKGDVMSAQDILVEMMDKSLKPDFSIYVKIMKQLRKSGRTNLASDLEGRHSKFLPNSRTR